MEPYLYAVHDAGATQMIGMFIEIEDDARIDMSLMTRTVIATQDPTTVVCLLAGMIIMDTAEGAARDMPIEIEFMYVDAMIMVTMPAVGIRMKDHAATDVDVAVDMVVTVLAILA